MNKESNSNNSLIIDKINVSNKIKSYDIQSNKHLNNNDQSYYIPIENKTNENIFSNFNLENMDHNTFIKYNNMNKNDLANLLSEKGVYLPNRCTHYFCQMLLLNKIKSIMIKDLPKEFICKGSKYLDKTRGRKGDESNSFDELFNNIILKSGYQYIPKIFDNDKLKFYLNQAYLIAVLIIIDPEYIKYKQNIRTFNKLKQYKESISSKICKFDKMINQGYLYKDIKIKNHKLELLNTKYENKIDNDNMNCNENKIQANNNICEKNNFQKDYKDDGISKIKNYTINNQSNIDLYLKEENESDQETNSITDT